MYEGEGEIKVRIMLLSDGGHIMHTSAVRDKECIVTRCLIGHESVLGCVIISSGTVNSDGLRVLITCKRC